MPNSSYAYRIVNVDKYLDYNHWIQITNDTLSSKEEMQIFKKIESLTQNNQVGFTEIEDDLDTVNDIEEEIFVEYSDLSIIMISSLTLRWWMC